jgi:hypothetical protein
MAGNRLYSEFSNDNGDVYRVSIYDTNAAWNTANASTFKLGSEGFTLSYSGNNEQQHQPIIPSTVEFTLYEETSAHTQTLDLMFSFPEGRLLQSTATRTETTTYTGAVSSLPSRSNAVTNRFRQLSASPPATT